MLTAIVVIVVVIGAAVAAVLRDMKHHPERYQDTEVDQWSDIEGW